MLSDLFYRLPALFRSKEMDAEVASMYSITRFMRAPGRPFPGPKT